MPVYSRKDIKWESNNLILGKKPSGFGIEQVDMYYVRWPDGALSEDFYNLVRAKEHAISLALLENQTEDQK